jgi:cyclic pyranopterin phosphate synthase
MDVGNANNWISEKIVSKKEIVETIDSRFPLREVGRDNGTAPSVDYEFVDGLGDIGIIASVTEPFCSSCTRARLTADGKLVTCLFSNEGHDLKSLIRGGATDRQLIEAISSVWSKRTDRYSDERLAAMNSAEGYQPKAHHKIEMITLGG